jgi:predicted RNA-binding protein (virulence factor B family)
MILIFRKYTEQGQVDLSVDPIERECAREDKDSVITELENNGYELECIFEDC